MELPFPDPIVITLLSGKAIKVRSYVSAGDLMAFAKLQKQGTPRERFVALVTQATNGDEISEEEISAIPDEELIELGTGWVPDFEEDFAALRVRISLSASCRPLTNPLNRTIKQLLSYSVRFSTPQWPSLQSAERLYKMLGLSSQSMQQANFFVNRFKPPAIDAATSAVRFVPPTERYKPSDILKDIPHPSAKTNQLLNALVGDQRQHATDNLEVQKAIVETLQGIARDSQKSSRETTNQNRWILAFTVVGTMVSAAALVVAIIVLMRPAAGSAPTSKGANQYVQQSKPARQPETATKNHQATSTSSVTNHRVNKTGVGRQ